ncbi:hypothetical protein EV697_10450 [Bisgaardia hudsonensis]|uniref:Uncharacterized protein n=1 Tax=Bisgaardia hudsonensis TaxID=109472 RepID=A0A4R2MWY9_9PAST|nr:hypothetical protein EV697_10450 [Bisgaardia hudsonensis]
MVNDVLIFLIQTVQDNRIATIIMYSKDNRKTSDITKTPNTSSLENVVFKIDYDQQSGRSNDVLTDVP